MVTTCIVKALFGSNLKKVGREHGTGIFSVFRTRNRRETHYFYPCSIFKDISLENSLELLKWKNMRRYSMCLATTITMEEGENEFW